MLDFFCQGEVIQTAWYSRPEMISAWFGLLGVTVGGIISWLSSSWNRTRNLKITKKRSAVLLAGMLENYAKNCSIYLANTGREIQGSEEIDRRGFGVPEFPGFSEAIDFSSIDPEIAAQALLLEGETGLENYAISTIEQDRNDSWNRDIWQRIGKHGRKFQMLADSIREKSNLPKPNPEGPGWDYKSFLDRAANAKE